MLIPAGQAILGFALLFLGAKWLVTGSASLARSIGIPPLVIGLTVVAFGTSAPELLVSVMATLQDRGAIALGNVVGSNIANIGLILGAAAVIRPLRCQLGLLYKEIPIMLAVTVALILLTFDSRLSFLDGILLFAGIVAFTWYSYAAESKEPAGTAAELVPPLPAKQSRLKQIALIVGGILVLFFGGDSLITGAVEISRRLGVSEKLIGLTLIAVGTSLPELATSIVAALKREADISIGNILGSNIFNVLAVLGISAMVKTISIDDGLLESGFLIDYAVMLAFSLLTLLLMKSGRIITRIEGFGLLGAYSAYVVYLALRG